MVSLELEARLDNLLSNAQKETEDIDLYGVPNMYESTSCKRERDSFYDVLRENNMRWL